MFHVPKPTLDHVGSALAFTLMLASWVVAYIAIVPADPVQRHAAHVAQVMR